MAPSIDTLHAAVFGRGRRDAESDGARPSLATSILIAVVSVLAFATAVLVAVCVVPVALLVILVSGPDDAR